MSLWESRCEDCVEHLSAICGVLVVLPCEGRRHHSIPITLVWTVLHLFSFPGTFVYGQQRGNGILLTISICIITSRTIISSAAVPSRTWTSTRLHFSSLVGPTMHLTVLSWPLRVFLSYLGFRPMLGLLSVISCILVRCTESGEPVLPQL